MIHLLDEATINQIAAGEVVERPSAVVKELIENAMDAGATAITAEIKEGGLSFIRITDNGAGISKEEIPMAFLRHATSKIRTAEDLLSVKSLGFRGEALSSIAAVAQVELITKTPSDLNGYRYIIEGGEEKSMEEIGCPTGTTIIVRNIFYNTPARRKFLKSAVTEAGYISDLMERLMVSHPGISFKFIVNNQVKLQSSGNNNSKDILYQIYGRDITKELLPVEFSSEEVSISGYIGKPLINRGNRNYENYFINGRYIKNNVISKAIEEAYKPFLMQHKYPFTSLYFEINPELIDVNVHPQKLEIRLKNSEDIYRITLDTIRNTILGKEIIPKVTLVEETPVKEERPVLPEPFEVNRRKQFEAHISNNKENGIPASLSDNKEGIRKDTIGDFKNHTIEALKDTTTRYDSPKADNRLAETATQYQTMVQDKAAKQLNLFEETVIKTGTSNDNGSDSDSPDINTSKSSGPAEIKPDIIAPFLSKEALEEHRIIGQLFATYWLVEYQNELFIIDQHAAHEKVLYERIMAAAKTKTCLSQQLLPPIVLSLTLREQNILQKHEEVLKSLGYEFEHFGGNEFSVRAVPADLYGLSDKELVMEFLDELAEDYSGGSLNTTSILEKVASLSCKAAVKANHTLTVQEAEALIKELLTLENPYHCPHGRPVIISMSQYELERKFKRIV